MISISILYWKSLRWNLRKQGTEIEILGTMSIYMLKQYEREDNKDIRMIHLT